MNATPEKASSEPIEKKDAPEGTAPESKDTNADVAKQDAEQVALEEIKEELGDFVSVLTKKLEQELIQKYGADSPETDRIVGKVKDLAKIGTWLQVKWVINSVMWFFSFAQKLKPDLKVPEQLIQIQEKISPVADKIDTVEQQFTELTSWNMIEKAMMQAQWIDMSQLAWEQSAANQSIDTALTTLEQQAKQLREQKNITPMAYKMWYAKLLQGFIVAVKEWTNIQSNNTQAPSEQKDTSEQKTIYEDVWYNDDDYDMSHAWDIEWMKYTDMVVLDDVKSHWVMKSETWMTLCSKTARLDLETIFGIKTPQAWSALASKDLYKQSDIQPSETQKDDNRVVDIQETYNENMKWDVFDIFTKSTWAPQYGHRCWGFRSYPSGKVYVVDYYMKGDEYKKPVPIEQYMKEICADKKDWGKWRTMLKIVWYDTKKQIVDEDQIVLAQQQKNPSNKERSQA